MKQTLRALAIASVLLCAACAEKSSTTAALIDLQERQFSAVQWDAITTSAPAPATNNSLIQMR